jgi:hypothetical protein
VQSPPFPCFEQFILEATTVAGVEPVIDRPLLYIQVCTVVRTHGSHLIPVRVIVMSN